MREGKFLRYKEGGKDGNTRGGPRNKTEISTEWHKY